MPTTSPGGPTRQRPRRPGWPASCARPASRPSTALQARATADPAWFWGAAADDIGVAWQRRPREILDLSGGPAWARWWTGGAFDWARAAVEPRAARDPDAIAVTWEGEDGAVRELTRQRAARCGRVGSPAARRRSGSARATGSGSCCRCCPRPSSRSSRSRASARSSRRSSRATPRPPSRRAWPTARRSC